jgi:uncharacterized membrane protein
VAEKRAAQWVRTAARILLGIALAFAGSSHLGSDREEFRAQVPTWLPLDADFVVLASGVVEIILGLSLVFLWRWKTWVGLIAAAFFIAIFPGNISQFVNGIDAFGLDTDEARGIRLLFQPLLVLWALWSTSAWSLVRALWRRLIPRRLKRA